MMRLILIVLITCLFVGFSTKSENEKKDNKGKTSLEVIVLDAFTKDPLPAVKIKIAQNKLEAYTDFDGYARFNDVTNGFYDIEISFISYQKQHIKAFELNELSSRVMVSLRP